MIIKRETITTREVRSKLREPNNRSDDLFTSFCMAKGVLDARYKFAAPTGINRMIGKEPIAKFGNKEIGISDFRKLKYKEFKGFRRFVPEKQFNPMNKDTINSGTKLAKAVSLGRFTGGSGSRFTLNKYTHEERQQIARNFYLQSALMTGFYNNEDKFDKYNLVVTEGPYHPETTESLTSNGLKDKATKGQVAVYEVVDQEGIMSPEKTFDVAQYWKDNFLFDELILSYDTVDPNSAYNAQIIVVMPEVGTDYNPRFNFKVKTEFNFNLLVNDGLAEAFVRTA